MGILVGIVVVSEYFMTVMITEYFMNFYRLTRFRQDQMTYSTIDKYIYLLR